MKILKVATLAIPEIKVIRYARFHDHRGYFTEHFRRGDFQAQLSFINGIEFVQCNESRSQPGTIRGLHFQWNPCQGKLVRTLAGHMVDLVLDIRKGSPSFGKAIAYDMPGSPEAEYGEWIWVPPGFAHGNYYLEPTQIEYFCSGEYNPRCEAVISPLAADIDWSLCDLRLKAGFDRTAAGNPLISDKDRNGYSVESWSANPNSANFLYAS